MAHLENSEIQAILPHRYPMLMVDRIEEITPGRVVGIKNVTANEPFFQGHFPGFPVMPGVLIVEAMAQVAGVLVLQDVSNRDEKLVFFAAIEEAKFRRPVVPGDTLRIEMEILRRKETVIKARGVAKVGELVAAEATLLCSIVDRNRQK